MERLGGHVIAVNMAHSSVLKGESLADTIRTVESYSGTHSESYKNDVRICMCVCVRMCVCKRAHVCVRACAVWGLVPGTIFSCIRLITPLSSHTFFVTVQSRQKYKPHATHGACDHRACVSVFARMHVRVRVCTCGCVTWLLCISS